VIAFLTHSVEHFGQVGINVLVFFPLMLSTDAGWTIDVFYLYFVATNAH
jgi:hypothetical protein